MGGSSLKNFRMSQRAVTCYDAARLITGETHGRLYLEGGSICNQVFLGCKWRREGSS